MTSNTPAADGLAAQLQSTLTLGDPVDQSRLAALEARQTALLARIAALESRLGAGTGSSPAASPSLPVPTSTLPIASPVQARLEAELLERGLTAHCFVRAPPEYYDRPLEFRQAVVGAASTHHLCKTIVMENTRVEADTPGVTKYWMVVVQYTARLHSDKLRAFVQSAHNGSLSKKQINMRLAPEEVSDALTGFEHNGVSPIGPKTRLPIIFSHRIAALEPTDIFWLGAGEVDLKVGIGAADFIAAYQPHVVDCTYDD